MGYTWLPFVYIDAGRLTFWIYVRCRSTLVTLDPVPPFATLTYMNGRTWAWGYMGAWEVQEKGDKHWYVIVVGSLSSAPLPDVLSQQPHWFLRARKRPGPLSSRKHSACLLQDANIAGDCAGLKLQEERWLPLRPRSAHRRKKR